MAEDISSEKIQALIKYRQLLQSFNKKLKNDISKFSRPVSPTKEKMSVSETKETSSKDENSEFCP